ncbi:MAG: hypothetical protein GWN21_11395 [Gammaproteobacteria bacterium]|nr:hypothetical protein [Xanthomonadales bacterium]NIS05527.1 hypothetical protein [Gammaproteobacteria bacterium]NIV48134.1 hypothetical protein [Gammaproteobacteria bacterium]NIW02773.1 hypothetical protein [Gammaproteobacteria bacterium]NIW55836.1 hypothetical protein [Gammaproteobacteria bacterium]
MNITLRSAVGRLGFRAGRAPDDTPESPAGPLHLLSATDVVEQANRIAGATAIFDGRPFERRFRDAHAVSHQVQGRRTNYETVGRFILGLNGNTICI